MSLRLFCAVAHPDDECFAFGGALALYAQRGVETDVVCLTDGQAATHRGTAHTGAELGAMRRDEFARSCRVLGARHFELLPFQDKDLENHSLHALATPLVERLRRFRPHVVLTFGGEGALNNHPDHTTVSAATTAAFHWAGNPKRMPELGPVWRPQRLYYLTYDFFYPGRLEPRLAPWSCALDIRSVLDRKLEAFRQHTSQAPLVESTRDLFREHGEIEHYTLAYTTAPGSVTQTTDLFEGVTEDPSEPVSPDPVR